MGRGTANPILFLCAAPDAELLIVRDKSLENLNARGYAGWPVRP